MSPTRHRWWDKLTRWLEQGHDSPWRRVFEALAIAAIAAIEPVPWVAFIVVLATKRGTTLAWWYLSGWIASIIGVAILVELAHGKLPHLSGHTPARLVAWIELLCGIALAVIVRRRRREPAPPPSNPKWLAKIDGTSGWFAFALGLLISPWPVLAAADAVMVRNTSHHLARILGYVAIGAVASLPYIVVLLLARRRPERTKARLSDLRGWIERHQRNAADLAMGIIAIYLIINGLVTMSSMQ